MSVRELLSIAATRARRLQQAYDSYCAFPLQQDGELTWHLLARIPRIRLPAALPVH